MSALAQPSGPVDAYQGSYADNMITGGANGLTIGTPRVERNAVIARLEQRRDRPTSGTMAGEPAGGSGIGGSAGGVGAR